MNQMKKKTKTEKRSHAKSFTVYFENFIVENACDSKYQILNEKIKNIFEPMTEYFLLSNFCVVFILFKNFKNFFY